MVPLVSVIIPTHNRARYVIPTIRSVLTASADIEVVVSDTSEIDLISPEFVNDPCFSRLRLVRPNKPMSVVDNFNLALFAATGEYLVFIGDDDFISSRIEDVARWANEQKIDSIRFSFPVLYYWDDFVSSTRWNAQANTISITPFSGLVTHHDADTELLKALDNLGGGVYGMPRAYAGMISRQLADTIISKYGQLFGGVSPDIYSAAMISIEARRCTQVDYPIIIPGASGASTSGQSASGTHVGVLRDNPHIGAFSGLIWDARIPEFYSVQTVWSFSLLKAVERFPRLMEKISFGRLYVKCLISHPQYFRYVFSASVARVKDVGLIAYTVNILLSILKEFFRISLILKSRFFIKKPKYLWLLEGDVSDTLKAFKKLEIHLLANSPKLKLDKLF